MVADIFAAVALAVFFCWVIWTKTSSGRRTLVKAVCAQEIEIASEDSNTRVGIVRPREAFGAHRMR